MADRKPFIGAIVQYFSRATPGMVQAGLVVDTGRGDHVRLLIFDAFGDQTFHGNVPPLGEHTVSMMGVEERSDWGWRWPVEDGDG